MRNWYWSPLIYVVIVGLTGLVLWFIPSASTKEKSPLNGKNPRFTASPIYAFCPSNADFCPYETCSVRPPKTTDAVQLWSAYVVPGKDGPLVICEWR